MHAYNIVRTCRYMTIERNTKGIKEHMTTHILTFSLIIRLLVQGHIARVQCQVLYYISNQALLLHLSEHIRGMRIRSDMSSIPNPHLHDKSSSTWRLKCRCAFGFL